MMKTSKTIFALLAAILVLSACETVVELDFNDADPTLVIQGVVTDDPGPYFIRLNESVSFYDDGVYTPRSGAIVTISDDLGNSEVLSEDIPGTYFTSDLQGQPGVTYTLTVETEGETYTAFSTMPGTLVPIDFLEQVYQEENIFDDEGYYVTAWYTDPADEDNFWRLKFFLNGEPYVYTDEETDEPIGVDNNLNLDFDKFWSGNQSDWFFENTVEVGDTVLIELEHISEASFDYYRTLLEAIDGGGVAPANPISNFGASALGYFGAHSVDRQEIVIEP